MIPDHLDFTVDVVSDPEDRPDVESLCGDLVDDSDVFPTDTEE
jgi:hypothetical protein